MAVRLTNQLERLSYTRRDLELIDEEVQEYIRHFIPVIKDTGQANVGTKFRQLLEALIDKLNYSQDVRFRQSVYRTVTELQAALDISEATRYNPTGVSSASTDLTVTVIGGVAPSGGIPIPQYSQFMTNSSPIKSYLSLESSEVPEGAGSTSLGVIQGIRVVDEVIIASTNGDPNEFVRMSVARTPHEYIEVKVDGVEFTQVDDFRDSEREDRHFTCRMDANRFTTITFGDGTYGAVLAPGSQVTVTYIQSLGKTGNSPRNTITKALGTLAQLISVTNEEVASGGHDGDEVEDIVRKAPKHASTFLTAFNDESYENLAETLIPGVFQAKAAPGDGAFMDLYIMPQGGGLASSVLLQQVKDGLVNQIHGMTLNTHSLISAHILIDMRVILKSQVNKTLARKEIYEAISAFKLDGTENTTGALYFRNLTIGRGFALSDVSGILENLRSGSLVDFVDFFRFTRYPSPVASNPSSPSFQGEIVPLSEADYDDWTIIAGTASTFDVFKNGLIDSSGTIGVSHTTDDGSLRFTLGTPLDVFTPGDNWTFSASRYNGNMRLNDFEFMELARDSDLKITIYHPGEFTLGRS